MKTSTVLLNGVTVAAASTSGAGHTRVDLTALTVNDAILNVVIVNGTTPPGVGKEIELYLAFSQTSFTATDAPVRLGAGAQRYVLRLSNTASQTIEWVSDVIPLKATYAYIWYKHNGLNAAVTLTAQTVT